MNELPTVSVVIPTYRRPDALLTCLEALGCQTLKPLEVLVCRRVTDEPTAAAVSSLSERARALVREVIVGPADNLARALNAGIESSRGDYVTLTDDDAEAPPDWLEKLVAGFDDERIAGVGGRDIQMNKPPRNVTVGKVTWYGKVIGNHHVGMGQRREVDVLKGVNCCFRGDLIRSIGVDSRLRGRGNVVHIELAICLKLRKGGWLLHYNPEIAVLHHCCPRGDGDTNNRGGFDGVAMVDAIHNQTLILEEYLSPRGRLMGGIWKTLVGSSNAPGLVLALASAIRGDGMSILRCRASLAGRRSARRSIC